MKKFITLMSVVLLVGLISSCATPNTPEARAQRAQAEARNMALYNQAVEALKGQSFVLEADNVMSRRGRVHFVSPTTNFVMVDGDRVTVQVASNSAIAGPNGIGGITLDGNLSSADINTNSRGDVTYTFFAQGVAISAQINITLARGGNTASVRVNPNFSSNNVTMNGTIIPLELSNVYKGRSI